MKKWLEQIVFTVAALAMGDGSAFAQPPGAIMNGNWNNSSIWTTGTVPTSADQAYIGSLSYYPSGSAATVTVQVTSSDSVLDLFLGNGLAGSTGTLDLAGGYLNVLTALYIGSNNGTGAIQEENGGYLTANTVFDNASPLTFGMNDAIGFLRFGYSTVTTTAAGNITGSVAVVDGGTLTLGANLTLTSPGYSIDSAYTPLLQTFSSYLNMQDGSTLNMKGNTVNADAVLLGWYTDNSGGKVQAVNVVNQGTITANYLYVGNNTNYKFTPTDSVGYLGLSNSATATINPNAPGAGNVTGSVDIFSGSTLNLTQNLNLSGYLNVQDAGSTLNMAGFAVSANSVLLGWNGSTAVTIGDRGAFSNVTNLYVGNPTVHTMFDLNPNDSVTNFYLNNATSTLNSGVSYLQLNNGSVATPTAAGAVGGSIDVLTGSTLNVNQPLNLSGYLNVQDAGSTLNNATGYAINANQIMLGWNGSSAVTLTGQGTITANQLFVGNGMTYNFQAADKVGYLALGNLAVATTNASAPGTGNITGSVDIFSGSTLNLNQPLNLSGYLNVQDAGSTFNNANGYAINANQIMLGWNGTSAVNMTGQQGTITANGFYLGNGMAYNFLQNDAVGYLALINATASTATAGNVTGSVDLFSGSTLNLGANLNLSGINPITGVSGSLNVQDGSTLNMNSNTINANQIMLGWNGTSAVNIQNQGTMDANSLYVGNGTNFSFHQNDVVGYLAAAGAGTVVNTANSGNVTGSVDVFSGSTLNLGGNLSLSGTNPNTGVHASLNVQDAGSTLNMTGYTVNANTVLLGWNGSSAVTVLNQGSTLTANSLYVGNGTNFTFQQNDSVGYLAVSGASTMVTTAGYGTYLGNVTGSVDVLAGGTLNVGGVLYLQGTNPISGVYSSLNVQDGSTLNMTGAYVYAFNTFLGFNGSSSVNIENQGSTLFALNLSVGNNTNFNFQPHDTVYDLTLNGGATATTAAPGNVDGNILVDGSGSTLTLGASLTVSSISEQNGGIINSNGYSINAGEADVSGQTLALGLHDVIGTLNASNGATVTTSSPNNITGAVTVDGTGTSLTLGSPLSLTGAINLTNGGTLDAMGQSISASLIAIGGDGLTAASLLHPGSITTNYLYLDNGSQLTLDSGITTVADTVNLTGVGTTLTVHQTTGQTTEFTLDGVYASSLVFDPGPTLVLDLAAGSGWIFRWQDPTGGNWINMIDSYIANGDIVINAPNGYQVYDQNGFTYIGPFSAASVPEPSSIVMLALGCAAVIGLRMRQRRLAA